MLCLRVHNKRDGAEERGKERIGYLKASSRVPFLRLRRATKTDKTSVIDHINKLRGSDSRNFISRGHNSPASGRNAEKEREKERERGRERERQRNEGGKKSGRNRSDRAEFHDFVEEIRARAAGTARLLSQTICDEPVYRLSHRVSERDGESSSRDGTPRAPDSHSSRFSLLRRARAHTSGTLDSRGADASRFAADRK